MRNQLVLLVVAAMLATVFTAILWAQVSLATAVIG
jgi:hypothetical protein